MRIDTQTQEGNLVYVNRKPRDSSLCRAGVGGSSLLLKFPKDLETQFPMRSYSRELVKTLGGPDLEFQESCTAIALIATRGHC